MYLICFLPKYYIFAVQYLLEATEALLNFFMVMFRHLQHLVKGKITVLFYIEESLQ